MSHGEQAYNAFKKTLGNGFGMFYLLPWEAIDPLYKHAFEAAAEAALAMQDEIEGKSK